MSNRETLMKEFYLVLIDSLRKQAFSVILLVCACAGLWILRQQDKDELNTRITVLEQQLIHCTEARDAQSVEIATLKVSIAILENRQLQSKL